MNVYLAGVLHQTFRSRDARGGTAAHWETEGTPRERSRGGCHADRNGAGTEAH